MTEHLSIVIVCGALYDVLTRIVTTITTTVPGWLTTAVIGLVVCGVMLTVLGVGALALFVLQLYWAILDERDRHA